MTDQSIKGTLRLVNGKEGTIIVGYDTGHCSVLVQQAAPPKAGDVGHLWIEHDAPTTFESIDSITKVQVTSLEPYAQGILAHCAPAT